MRKSRLTFLITSTAAAAAVGGWALSTGGSASNAPPAAPATIEPAAAGIHARFAFLARQKSNVCGLQPSAIMGMSGPRRLQGSCCFPMSLGAYRSQVAGLRSYAKLSVIPADPYDVPVSLAKLLVAYDRTIQLTPTQARTYAHAMRMSSLKGPCCCHCWRWTAFRGLSRYLISRRHWSTRPVARLTELLEGCGGPMGS
mgnify:CR=1 FL=1